MMRVENFVPRQEIEKDQKARDERIGALEDRVKTIEHRAWGGMAAIAGTFLTAVWQAFKH